MGKTAHDVVRGLGTLGAHGARKIAYEPTGVTPGYNAALGGTVTPDGRLRYVSASATASGSLVGLAQRGSESAVNVAQGGTARLPFGTAVYGAVTAGATAFITPAVAGLYRAECGIYVDGASGAYALGDFFDVQLYRQDTNAYLATLDYKQIDAGTYAPTVYIHGFAYVQLAAGEAVYLKAENQSSVAGNATAPTGSADFFALTYIASASAIPLAEIMPNLIGDDTSNPEPISASLVSDPGGITTFDTDWYYVTAPTTGSYRFTYTGTIVGRSGSTWTTGDTYQLKLYVNGVYSVTLYTHTITAPEAAITDFSLSATGDQTLSLTAGDTVVLYIDGTWADIAGQDVLDPVSSWKVYHA